MKIELREISVRDLVDDYRDDGDGGVRGYSGKLDIRPPFQREFVYKQKQRDAVIDTVTKGFPLNVMYWADRGDETYEIIDGQQRTISIAQYIEGDFPFRDMFFHNLTNDKQERILNYPTMIYVCTGTDSEKLEWFKTINIAGEQLTDQELRNAVYSGSWVSEAKRYFSRNGCPAYMIGNPYLRGVANRQDYLETAIRWISKGNIEEYMGRHQHDPNAKPIQCHFESVIEWVEKTFPKKRNKLMQGVDWGTLYDEFENADIDPSALENEIQKLIDDDDVTKQAGIYPYVLTRNEKYLNIRAFTISVKRRIHQRQSGKCANCGEAFELAQMEADHITPWSEGGKTEEDNCQMLCKDCNRRKGAK